MALKKTRIVVDRGRCTGIGICESISDKYFEVGDDGVLVVHHDKVDDGDRDDIELAVRSCPARALMMVDGGE
jgi:ferredoxin